MMPARSMESLEIGMGRSHAGYQTVGMHLSGSHRHGCWRFGAIVSMVLLVALISAVKITPSAILAEDSGYYFLSIGDFGTAQEAQFSVAKQVTYYSGCRPFLPSKNLQLDLEPLKIQPLSKLFCFNIETLNEPGFLTKNLD